MIIHSLIIIHKNMETKANEKRKLYIDIIKIFACFCVIADHTNYLFGRSDLLSNAGTIDTIFIFIYATVFHVAVTLFVMSSGALLLGKKDETYKKCFIRIFKCIVTIIIFTLPYYLKGEGIDNFNLKTYIRELISGDYVMSFWYMYMYLSLLIMLPIIRKMIENFHISDYIYFFLFSILCSFDFITGLNEYYNFPLFATYIGIFIMGYFLDNHEIRNILTIKISNSILLVATTIFFLFDIIVVSLYSLNEIRIDNTVSNRFYCWDNIFYLNYSRNII